MGSNLSSADRHPAWRLGWVVILPKPRKSLYNEDMKKSRWVFALFLFIVACNVQNTISSPTTPPDTKPTATQTPPPTSTPPDTKPTATQTPPPTSTPTSTFTPTPEFVYQAAFGIDYANPDQYLEPGEQTNISSPEVVDPLRSDEKSISHLQRIFQWLKKEFEPYSAGGNTIGVVTTDQLLEEGRLGGCNDHGLVYVAVARELGYPAVLVITNSIAWMELYQMGEAEQYVGHVFVEVYLDGRWVLIDSTNGWYVEEGYGPSNPVIPLQGSIAGSSEEVFGFYVTNKGIDQWDMGIRSRSDRYVTMEEVASLIALESLEYPTYTFESFRKK